MARHSSDERLLALLDGELGLIAAVRVRAHLRACWECRGRLAKLEAAAQSLASASAQARFLPRERIDSARLRFRAEASTETVRQSSGGVLSLALLGRRGLAFGFAGMLSVAAVVTVWQRSSLPTEQPPQSAPSVMAHPAPTVREQPAALLSTPSPRPVEPAAVEPERAPVVASVAAAVREREVALLWLLHQAGACRGQETEVHRNGDRLVVRGVVASSGRRQDLAARIADADPAALVELQDLEHAGASSASGAAAPTVRVTRLASAAAGETLVRDWLTRQKTDPGVVPPRIVEIANASVAAADAAWSEAWSLHDLHVRFGSAWPELTDASRTAVLSMMRDHWSELQTLAAKQRRVLGGVLVTAPPGAPDLLAAVRQWNDSVQQLFAPAEPVADSPATLVTRISGALARVEAMSGDDQALTSFVLRPVPNSAEQAHAQPSTPTKIP